jgi:hypothetical protein
MLTRLAQNGRQIRARPPARAGLQNRKLVTMPLFGVFRRAIIGDVDWHEMSARWLGLLQWPSSTFRVQRIEHSIPPISYFWAMPEALRVQVVLGIGASLFPVTTARPMLPTPESSDQFEPTARFNTRPDHSAK